MQGNLMQSLHNNKTITTERLLLRPFTAEDVDAVYAYASDPQATKYLSWAGVSSREDALKVIQTIYSSDGMFAIELRSSSVCVGSAVLNLDAENEKASFGYVLNRVYWNKGIMTEALERVFKCTKVL